MAAAKKNGGGLGGLIFAGIIAAFVFAPGVAGFAIAAGVLWMIFAANAKFSAGHNPALITSGQRGQAIVQRASRSQVRSRAGKGPWTYTWTILLSVMPPRGQPQEVTVYRKLPERAGGPLPGQRFATWFDANAPQRFHVDWNSFLGEGSQQTPPPAQQQRRVETRPTPVVRPSGTASAGAISYSVSDSAEMPLPVAEADGGFGFDFAAHGQNGRARIEDFAAQDDGSTELALTVMPRRGTHYRTIVNTFVPEDRRHRLARGMSLQVRLDPSAPGRLMIVG